LVPPIHNHSVVPELLPRGDEGVGSRSYAPTHDSTSRLRGATAALRNFNGYWLKPFLDRLEVSVIIGWREPRRSPECRAK
jgi:hypothetical protein